MNKKFKRFSLNSSSLIVASLLAISCTNTPLKLLGQSFTSNPSYLRPNAEFCNSDPNESKPWTKILFVVDRSGSNETGNGGSGTGTDPDGTRRYDAIKDLIRATMARPGDRTEFGVITFHQSSPGVLIPITNDKQAVLDAIGTVDNPGAGDPEDAGATPFVQTLDLVKRTVEDDIKITIARLKREHRHEKFIVQTIFLSDGVPTDAEPISPPPVPPNPLYPGIIAQVELIKGLKDDEDYGPYILFINQHTVFYYNDIDLPTADRLMSEMARAGRGLYFKFGGGGAIDLTALIPPDYHVENQLAEVYATNLNKMWINGKLYNDSDGDGLSDYEEMVVYNSDPRRQDSDVNGMNDRFETLITGHACRDPECRPSGAQNYMAFCQDFLKPGTGELGVPPLYVDSDNDDDGVGLNDCAEAFIGSQKDNPDTMNAFFPDNIAIRSRLNFTQDGNQLYTDLDNDRKVNRLEVKNNTPWDLDNSRIAGLLETQYILSPTTPPGSLTCWSLDVRDMVFGSMSDEIQLTLLESSSLSLGMDYLRIMRRAVRTINPDGSVRFYPGDFH